MAKAKLPLMGIKAAGQLAKSLVYFNWKGVNAVRSHVVPSNPKTESQQEVRSDFTDQVDAWHDPDMLEDDKLAWNRFAGVTKRAASGFNEFVAYYRKNYLETAKQSHLRSIVITSNTGGTVTLTGKTDATDAHTVKIYWGTSKTFMPNSSNASVAAGGGITSSMTGLIVGAKYFFYLIEESEGYYGRTGIFEVVAAS
jgi:hypothetical protein